MVNVSEVLEPVSQKHFFPRKEDDDEKDDEGPDGDVKKQEGRGCGWCLAIKGWGCSTIMGCLF